jgi:predicted nucleotidyltransferase
MRGEPAIYNKFLRTKMALSGVDLVDRYGMDYILKSVQHFSFAIHPLSIHY